MTMRDERADWREPAPEPSNGGQARPRAAADGRELTDIIELMFFAYRDFTGEADARLTDRGFGRAHHRVLYFVTRHPGMSVTDLLAILKITKQSLARVLKQLVERGYITQSSGRTDKRQRLLYPTARGEELADSLTNLQMARVARALAALPDTERDAVGRFLFGMISPDEQTAVAQLMAPAGSVGDCGKRQS
jgi:DNA-binding MarR family transcriptional regulator